MQKKRRTLLYQFGGIFLVFGFVLLAMCGAVTYYSEARIYREENLDMTRDLTIYLENFIKENPEDFAEYAAFYEAHHPDMMIDPEFTDYNNEYNEFMRGFSEKYPGKVLGTDIKVSELPYELQLDYYEYKHEYWLTVFEDLRRSLNLEYVYFIIPYEETGMVMYVCDVERVPREDDPEHMELGFLIENTYERFNVEWDTWAKGERLEEFQVVDNEYGHVYTYYNPLKIDGKKIGLICIDISFDKVNNNILVNTLQQMLKIMLVMFGCIAFLLFLLNNRYLKRVVELTGRVKQFSDTQDARIAEDIKSKTKGNDELSRLSEQVADMIVSLDEHVREIIDAQKALADAKEEVAAVSTLATRDSLTGIRNKLAYDQMCKDIDFKVAGGFKEFGIIMIDLNFLKRINDNYGHDKGNIAIKLLCTMICKTFTHSPVFRIGGDEFVVILENEDFEKREDRYQEFIDKVAAQSSQEGLPQWERVSAAAGMALFDPEIDMNIDNVFKRADKAMYEKKKKMKATRS